MRAALYARVSTERQADRGTIGSQLSLLREHIAAAGDELIGEYVDDGHSGARLDRPGLDALRDAAEVGLVQRVWCLSPDRLARAYAYQVLVLDELARFGVTVAFTDSPGLAACFSAGVHQKPSAPRLTGVVAAGLDPTEGCGECPASSCRTPRSQPCPSLLLIKVARIVALVNDQQLLRTLPCCVSQGNIRSGPPYCCGALTHAG